MDFWDFLRFQKGFISRVMAYWELPGESPKVQKSVSDAYPGNIGHLDHYVVFGTQSGAVQDIQMGKNCSLRGQADPFLTTLDHPMDPPKTSQTPLNPFSDLPYNQCHPSSYLTTQ